MHLYGNMCGQVTFGSHLIYCFLFCKNRFYTIKVMEGAIFYHLKGKILNFGLTTSLTNLTNLWPRCTNGWRGTVTTRPTGGTTSRWPICTPSVEMSGQRWVSQWCPLNYEITIPSLKYGNQSQSQGTIWYSYTAQPNTAYRRNLLKIKVIDVLQTRKLMESVEFHRESTFSIFQFLCKLSFWEWSRPNSIIPIHYSGI